jgi:hypothetical protein
MLTFVMVAILFFTGISLAIKFSISINKASLIINEMTKYVEMFIEFLKIEAAKVREKVAQLEVVDQLKTGSDIIKEKSQVIRQNRIDERRDNWSR